jgi:(p)ppGpp synthase/HD superfamily hydrolase
MTAQTFLDLYRELKLRHYKTQDLELIFHAHELATRIFSGSYRPTYKPFICHLVGTASVLGKCGERRELIAAAILHSAYPLGAFGDRMRDLTKQKRRVVSQCVGAEAEAIVYQYCIADW